MSPSVVKNLTCANLTTNSCHESGDLTITVEKEDCQSEIETV